MHALTITDENGQFNEKNFINLSRGKRSFAWNNIANADVHICNVLDAIVCDNVRVPRTGHLGDWSDIFASKAGSLDYNHAICLTSNAGYPLIFDLNQTENTDLNKGDIIYLPGSLIKSGIQTKKLNLECFEHGKFVPVNRQYSYFCPYLVVNQEGQKIPLTSFHRKNAQAFQTIPLIYQSEYLLAHEPLLVKAIEVMFQHLMSMEQPKRLLNSFIDRSISKNAIVERKSIQLSGETLTVGNTCYRSMKEIVDSILTPLKLANGQLNPLTYLSEAPNEIPLLSNHAMHALLSICHPQFSLATKSKQFPIINIHVQWGAIGMSGIPPYKKSYFNDNAKRVRSIFDVWVGALEEVSPTLFVVLPSAPFSLLPRCEDKRDTDIVTTLFDAVAAESEPDPDTIRAILHDSNIKQTSAYYQSRFFKLRSPLHNISNMSDSKLACLDSFSQLSFRTATTLMGELCLFFDKSCF